MISDLQAVEPRPAPAAPWGNTPWETRSRERLLAERRFLDPGLFPDRDRLAQAAAETLLLLWGSDSARLRTALERGMQAFWEYNNHPVTEFPDFLTLRELPDFMADPQFRERILSRVSDGALRNWWEGFGRWSDETRWEVVSRLLLRLEEASAREQRPERVLAG